MGVWGLKERARQRERSPQGWGSGGSRSERASASVAPRDEGTARVRSVSRVLTVLSAQVAPVAWDPAATLDKFEDHVRVARRALPDVDLMLFPELYLTAVDGFTSGGTGDWERRVAEEVPGPLTDRIGKIAAKAKRWIVAGSINERRGERIHNTAIMFSPDGELTA